MKHPTLLAAALKKKPPQPGAALAMDADQGSVQNFPQPDQLDFTAIHVYAVVIVDDQHFAIRQHR